MKRRLIKALLAALLLVGMAAPCALAAQDPLPTRVVLSDMGQLVGIEKTHYLLAQQPGGTLWGVYDTSGQQLMPYSRANLTYLGYNCFSTSEKKAGDPEAVNTSALLTLDGSLISYAQYGALRVYNHYWAAGWVLEPGTEEDYDYKDVGENPFKIVTCDIFHLGDWALPGTQKAVRPRLCATLTRDEFYAAQAHDKYLAIMDRQKKVTYYDGDFQPIETGFTSISRPALDWLRLKRSSKTIPGRYRRHDVFIGHEVVGTLKSTCIPELYLILTRTRLMVARERRYIHV